MFSKILVANRGEIALRIIRACREMGLKTVAAYSEPDRNALHTVLADEKICIGPARASESYLNMPNLLSAAEVTKSDAIHPGYGFLAENARFAEICQASGITFIGPSASLIKLMGNKSLARQEMKRAHLPIIPGSDEIVQDLAQAKKIAKKIGYPVIIKAAAGGGARACASPGRWPSSKSCSAWPRPNPRPPSTIPRSTSSATCLRPGTSRSR